jgi:PTH1 family peptidyl-tRNA hydrolase
LIRLIVGLGNPGKEYERTRHNAGFWLVERFASASGAHFRKDPKYQALVARMGEGPGGAGTPGAWLLLPQSFMNASGRPVQMLAGFFKIKPEEILVVHDELDFPPGTARIKQGGGIAGHNGLKDISQRIGSHDYWRLRLGIGRPASASEMADYVLHKPSLEEKQAIDAAIDNALALLPQMIAGDMSGAMQKLHSQDQQAKPAPAKKEPEKKAPEKKEPEKKSPEKKEPPKPQAPVKGSQASVKGTPPSMKAPEVPAKAEKPGLLKSLFGKK